MPRNRRPERDSQQPAAADPGAGGDDGRDARADPSATGEAGPSATAGAPVLTDRDRQILELEARTFRYVGAKERAIREQLGISRIAYFVRLNALLENPEALRAAPALVNRLRNRRTSSGDADDPRGDDRVA